ncbi:MAG: 16S rRNA (guanine(527)-N(7))-methyltransferase RsmG [Alphaproteobacteria bacterium]|nr:16S rRNA (guanine(527)-N(7))-methyltransferase RsmG [Alphaproteobacteria bacterium]
MERFEKELKAAEKDLLVYREKLLQWQKSVNLISNKTAADIWQRHFIDSARVFDFIPAVAKTLADFGSGAGFPGMVLAVLNKQRRQLSRIYLIESDLKKCLFLQEIKRVLALDAVVILNRRIEETALPDVDVVTARAVGTLWQMLDWGRRIIRPETTCLFLKGKSVDKELRGLPRVGSVAKIETGEGYVIKMEGVAYE